MGGWFFAEMGFAGLLALLVEVGNGGEHASQHFHLLILRNDRVFLGKAFHLSELERGESLVECSVIGGLIAEQDWEGGGEFAGAAVASASPCRRSARSLSQWCLTMSVTSSDSMGLAGLY